MKYKREIKEYLQESSKAFENLKTQSSEISEISEIIISALRAKKKLLICGNGGSAADSQHIAAEFVGRFEIDDVPLPAIALTTDTSIITAIGNDYSFNEIFSKQIKAIGNPGDVLICISTSGNSQNTIEASKVAKSIGMDVICFTGNNDSELEKISDYCFKANSQVTGIIQQIHITAGQLIAKICELEFYSN